MSLDYNKLKEGIEKGNTSWGLSWVPPGLRQYLSVRDHTPLPPEAMTGKTGMWIISGPIPWRISGTASGTATQHGGGCEGNLRRHPYHLWFHWFSAMMHGYMAFNKEGISWFPSAPGGTPSQVLLLGS